MFTIFGTIMKNVGKELDELRPESGAYLFLSWYLALIWITVGVTFTSSHPTSHVWWGPSRWEKFCYVFHKAECTEEMP